jgi:ribonuclease HII
MGWVIGLDEVGRGPLAGPLVVCGVLAEGSPVAGVGDSKQITPEHRRELTDQLLREPHIRHRQEELGSRAIDTYGIKYCLGACFGKAAFGLLSQATEEGITVDEVLIDGSPLWTPQEITGNYNVPVRFIVKGDVTEWSIGAASILAKVWRDQRMAELATSFPGYGWERNAGYGTADHIAAIKAKGLTPLHRETFCQKILAVPDDGPSIFEVLSNLDEGQNPE